MSEHHAPLDPDCQALLERLADGEQPDGFDVAAARADEARRHRDLAGTGPAVSSVTTPAIPVEDRHVPAVAFRPTAERAAGVLVWLHGGGWMVGSPETADFQARELAVASGCVVLAVDYRLAPEHRFPAGVEDAFAAVAWASEHADELGAEPGRLAVGGDSAGGNLAASVALMARDRGGPTIDFQLVIYAPTARDVQTPSKARLAEGPLLTRAALDWYWGEYLAHDGDATNPYASPLLAPSLAGLPPALVMVAGWDPLCDEGVLYAERLREHGVPATLVRHEGMVHGFIAFAGVIAEGTDAVRAAGRAVGEALQAGPLVA